MNEATEQLDARGLNCPLPILRTKKALGKMALNDILQVIASDPGSVKDMDSFCTQTGHELLSSQQDNDDYTFLIRKSKVC